MVFGRNSFIIVCMKEISISKYSYDQLSHIDEYIEGDNLQIASFLTRSVISSYCDNPSNVDKNKTALLLALQSDLIVGRYLLIRTRIKKNDIILDACSPVSFEVHESMRGKGIGSYLQEEALSLKEAPIYLFSLLSPSYNRMIRKPKYGCTVFDFPELCKLRNITSALEIRGMRGLFLKSLSILGNSALWLLDIPNKIRAHKLNNKYIIAKEKVVPDWAGDMCLNDGHKYAEYHDTAWLRWNLTHNLSGNNEDVQSFYSIKTKEGRPIAFFFTKERLIENVGQCKQMLCGVLCEWASIDKELTEADINILAFYTLSKDCYHMRTVTNDASTVRALKRRLFISHGNMQMGFKDIDKKHPDMVNQSLWRIRFGCCNSILF